MPRSTSELQRGDVRVEVDHVVEEVAHVGHAETFQQSIALCALGLLASAECPPLRSTVPNAMLGRRPLPLLLLLLPLLAHGFRAHVRPFTGSHVVNRGSICACEDPRATGSGAAERVPPPPLYDAAASQSTSQPSEDEDPSLRLGARILGGSFGGFAGNKLFSSLASIGGSTVAGGFTACTPFNKAGCQSLLREQQLQQQLQKQAQQVASLVSGVPPASASEPAPLLDHALPAAASSSSLDLVGFSATAGSADGPAPLLATLVCAVLGAIAFETLATNKVPPIPDPLLGGVWGSLHALVRGPSKATGLAATSAFAAVKTLVAEQLEKS